MKKIFLVSFLFLATGLQSIAAPRIVLEDKKENYTQTEHGYSLTFKLLATHDEYLTVMDQVHSMSDRLTMNVAEGSNNSYNCVFVINHQNQPEYVHKMLVAIGISDLEYHGAVQSLDSIIQILQSYL